MGPRCDSGREDGAAGWRVLLIQRGRTMIDARRLSSHVSLTDDNASVVLIGASAGELYAGARQTGPAVVDHCSIVLLSRPPARSVRLPPAATRPSNQPQSGLLARITVQLDARTLRILYDTLSLHSTFAI